MDRQVIHEDERTITYQETYQTHWAPDRIGGAMVIVNKQQAKDYQEQVARNLEKCFLLKP